MDILSFEGVSLTYQTLEGETKALENITFSIKEGEFVSIVGPSGCGKTTILSLVSGLLSATKGQVYLNGKKVLGTQNDTGYMLQRDQLFDWRTIRQNVALGLEVKRIKTPENLAYADELIEKYGLKEFSSHYPRQLSGGMRQRVALIRTLAFRPSVLLLDEPFSALDFQTRLSVCEDVYKIIRSEKKTVLLVTHDISEAVSLSDRVLVLSARPAFVKHSFTIDIEGTPLQRRENPKFSKYFDEIWKAVQV